tara:strand:- start:1844 stop:2176 length:333 start_codon:yes stop_codon:yes gene_type:complete
MGMSTSIDYGNLTKRIVFTENDHRHAQLILKLKYLRLTQATFFRHILTGLIEDDPRILEYTNEIAAKSKVNKAKSEKLQKTGRQKLRDLALSEGEVENIFDLLEKEFPEL